jgi:hypothetical protein
MRRYGFPALAVLGFFVVIHVVSAAAAALPNAADDPFGPFTGLEIGEPLHTADQYDCDRSYYYQSYARVRSYCMIQPETGPVITAIVTGKDEQIYSLWFHLRDVPIVQLIQHWGWPSTVKRAGSIYILWWGKRVYAVARDSRWLTAESPVRYVSVFNQDVDRGY